MFRREKHNETGNVEELQGRPERKREGGERRIRNKYTRERERTSFEKVLIDRDTSRCKDRFTRFYT